MISSARHPKEPEMFREASPEQRRRAQRDRINYR